MTFQGLQLLCRIPHVPTFKRGETVPLFSPTEEPLHPSLRHWAKSTKTHSTDQNLLCESRYNRHVCCSSKVPPAGETAAVWQMDIPRIPDAFPVKTLLERIQREKSLIREQRKSRWLLAQIIGGYESDWRTLAERDDLLRATKKARRSPHGLPPRSIVKDIDGRVPFYDPQLKTGSLPKSSEVLLNEWNTTLYEATKDEKTPLNEEIDFYPDSFVENLSDDGARSADDEKAGSPEYDSINNDGVKESGSWQGTEQVEPVPEPHRERWLKPRRFLFNPQDKKWKEVTADDIADVTNHPDFAQTAGEYAINFSDTRVKEVAEQLGLKPNTLSQRISRQELTSMYHGVDFSQTMGHYFCIVTLNGVDHLKILGKAEAPLPEVLAKFLDEWKNSETNAVKQARKTAKKDGVDQPTVEKREREAVERIRDAYETVIGLFVLDAEGFGGTYYHFLGHQELIRVIAEECVVILSV